MKGKGFNCPPLLEGGLGGFRKRLKIPLNPPLQKGDLMILFPYKPLDGIPSDTSQEQIKHGPYSDSQAVRVHGAMVSLQANNLAKDLLRFQRSIAGCGSVTSQDKGEPTAVAFLYINYAMGNETALKATENNVSTFQLSWRHRLNCDQVPMANGGMHACSRGSETYS